MIRTALALVSLVVVSSSSIRAFACDSDNDCAGGKTCSGGTCKQPSEQNTDTGVERTGALIVGAERLFGYTATTSTSESKGSSEPPIKATASTSSFGFLVTNATSALTVPRIGFDYNVASGFTLGGAFGYATTNHESETEILSTTSKSEGPKGTAVLFSPRVGYLTMSGATGFWGRAGITYFTSSEESSTGGTNAVETKVDASGLSAQFEPMLLLAPIDHVLFSIGGHLNLPLSGSVTSKQSGGGPGAVNATIEYDNKLTSYGLTAGVHAWF